MALEFARRLTHIGQEFAPTVLRRLVKTTLRSGLLGELPPSAVPAALEVAARHGLGVRSVHALHAAAHPGRLALVDDHRQLDYAEADAAINRVAHGLRAAGVSTGDRVVLMMPNRVEYLLAWVALFRLGAPAVHAGYRSSADELAYLVDHSRPKAIVASARTIDTVREALAHHPEVRILVTDGAAEGEELDWEGWLDGRSTDFPDISEAGIGAARGDNVVYTSGTTGRPRGAVRDFAQMGLVELSRLLERLPLRAAERHLVVSPLYHSGAQAFALLQSALGSTLYLRPHFDAADCLEALSRWEIHSVFMVPTMIRRLLELPEAAFRANPTPQLRVLISGAAPFPHELRLQAIERFGPGVVFDFYGATELGWVTLIDGHEMQVRQGSVGRPIGGQRVRILDRQGHPAPTGEVGTVYVRNEQTMRGYLDDAQATDATRRGEWMTVEDLGRVDDEGYLYLCGRDRDMVISGGVNIYPAEIEEALAEHPGVREAAVVGIPDPQWGEALVGFVVPCPAGEGATVDEASLQAYLRGRLASYKVPRSWRIVDELPRNPTGKILKRALRDSLAAEASTPEKP